MPSTIFPFGGAFTIDGVHSDVYGMTYTKWSHAVIPGLRVNLINIPGKVGRKNAGIEIDSRILRVNFSLGNPGQYVPLPSDSSGRSALLDQLHKFAAAIDPRSGPHKLILQDDWPAWYINVVPTAEVPAAPEYGVFRFEIQLEAADPHFYSTSSRTIAANMSSNQSLALPNIGNTYVSPVITLKGLSTTATTNVRIGISGTSPLQDFVYSGSFTSSDTVVIDCDNYSVTKNGNSDIANWSNDFPSIVAGGGNLTYTDNGVGANVSVAYTERNL